MKQSTLFTKTSKTTPREEESKNAILLTRAGFVHKEMAGVYSLLPLGLRVFKKIEAIIREEMNAIGGQEILMPSLHPKENWEKTGRWDGLDNLFRFTSFYTKQDYALGATHEEIVVPLAKNHIASYRDLPQYVYQIQNKFRDEKRAKSGILRGREFFMKDMYSFHKDEEDLDAYYEKVKDAYIKIFVKLGIGEVTYLTFASGGTFAKYSHEFQTVIPAGEDSIYLCKKCRVAVNKEIIENQSSCPGCGSKELEMMKAAEVGNIFKLKTKYSEPFNLTYKDEQGESRLVIMGCYGIGLNRIMGAIVEVYNDEKGMSWPESVAPFKTHLLSLEGSVKEGSGLYEELLKKGIEVLHDDRENCSAGEKLADADLIGIPWRIVISKKTLEQKSVEVKKRGESNTTLVKIEEFMKTIHA